MALVALLTLTPAIVSAQHDHHMHKELKQSKDRKLINAAIISPIMLLLDTVDGAGEGPGVDVCNMVNQFDAGVHDFGSTPAAVDNDPGKVAEHSAIFDFVGYQRATHVAIQNGRWSDPSTWYSNRIPGNCANAVVPQNITVSYDLVLIDRLNTLRVDGKLTFSTQKSSKIILDTLVVDPRGTLEIGTKTNPVSPDVEVEILIADNGNIDISRDPMLLSRGVVAHGRTRIHGAKKRTHVKVAIDPLENQDTITLSEQPDGWRVGDTVIVAATTYFGWRWDNSVRAVRYYGTQDEVRIIQAINGNTLTLDRALEYSHQSPRADLKTSVANYTRNVIFRTENASSVAVHQRGHVMFMHTNDVDVRYAQFQQLGRTNKEVRSFDVGDINPIRSDSNVRGRYSFHLHRIGTADVRNPAMVVGNAVFGSPGWGYTHHDSHAIFDNNASFDTFGAGFVAETGNETGVWSNNIAIKGEGNGVVNPKNGNQRLEFDIARNGVGFWFQGRMVRSTDNVAASLNHGYAYLHRGSGMLNFPAERFMLPEALNFKQDTSPDDPPILDFDNNEAFASTVGLYIVKANPNQGHDIYTVISDFTGWNVRGGIGAEYTSHYLIDNADLIAAESAPFFSPIFGIELGTNTSDMVIKSPKIDGFKPGIHLSKHYTNASEFGLDQYVVIDPDLRNIAVKDQYEDRDNSDQFLALNDLVFNRFDINVTKQNNRYEYLSPGTGSGDGVLYVGHKLDSIGTAPIPAGTETMGVDNAEMRANTRINGYYTDTNSGDVYTVVENYFSDRATGEIHKLGFKTYLGPDVVAALKNRFTSWRDGVDKGEIDIHSLPPITRNDQAFVGEEQDVVIDLVRNDSDPEGDRLTIDGVVQPRNGMVFTETDQSVRYRPLPGFIGADTFEYWATDGNGNFTKAIVTVDVSL